MKEFQYTWDDSCFLLHLQLNKESGNACQVEISRSFSDREQPLELERMSEAARSHRFIVSRSHPREMGFSIRYPDEITLEVFKIDDRAYYPTQSFFAG